MTRIDKMEKEIINKKKLVQLQKEIITEPANNDEIKIQFINNSSL